MWLLGRFWKCKKASRLILVSAPQRGWRSPRLGLRAGNVRPRAPGPLHHRSCSPAPMPHPKAPRGAGSLPLPLRRLGPLSPQNSPPTGRRRQRGGHTCDFSRSRLRAWSPLPLPAPSRAQRAAARLAPEARGSSRPARRLAPAPGRGSARTGGRAGEGAARPAGPAQWRWHGRGHRRGLREPGFLAGPAGWR